MAGGRPGRLISVRPGEEDPAAVALMGKLAVRSRQRWPAESDAEGFGAPGLLPLAES
jgi:hypothetical protein